MGNLKQKQKSSFINLLVLLILSVACAFGGVILLSGCNKTPAILQGPDVQGFTGTVTVGNVIYTSRGTYAEATGISGNPTTINIPDTVGSPALPITHIADGCFSGKTTITAVTIGANITKIGWSAFSGCTGATTLFWNATNYTEPMYSNVGGWLNHSFRDFGRNYGTNDVNGLDVIIGSNVNSIPPYFMSSTNSYVLCPNVKNLTFNAPSTLVSIGSNAFYKCIGLTGTLTIPNSVTNIGNHAFSGCSNLTGLNLGANVEIIGSNTFANCTGLSTLALPESVINISVSAFQNCTGLIGNLIIPNSVTTLQGSAFQGCTNLTGVSIGAGITKLGGGVFLGCSSVETLTWNALNYTDEFATATGGAFHPFYDFGKNCGTTVANGLTVKIGNNVQRIPANFLYVSEPEHRPNVRSLIFENSSSLTSIGSSAFRGCTGITGTLAIPNSVTSIGSYAFMGCSGLTGSLTLPNNLTIIEDSIFNQCSGFTGTIIIPNSVTSIGEGAFYRCTGLTELEIPTNCTRLYSLAFYGTNISLVKLNRFTSPSAITTLGNINALPESPSPLARIVVPVGAGSAYRAATNWSNAAIKPYICEATEQFVFNAGTAPANCGQVNGSQSSIAGVWSTIPLPVLRSTEFSVANNNWKQIGWTLQVGGKCLNANELLSTEDFEMDAVLSLNQLAGQTMNFYPVWQRFATVGIVVLHNVGGPNGEQLPMITTCWAFDPNDMETLKLLSADYMKTLGHALMFEGWYMYTSSNYSISVKLTETDIDGKVIIPWANTPFFDLFPVVHIYANWV